MYQTATQIINQVAAEVGLEPATDPYSSADSSFKQLTALLNSSGLLLLTKYDWQALVRTYAFVTDTRVPQNYDLPADFDHMIDNTGWMTDQNVPLMGPLNEQEWSYLLGRNLVSSTIYASYRISESFLQLFPNGDAGQLADQPIAYQYLSNHWVKPTGVTDPDDFKSAADTGTDVILYPATLIMLFLKSRWLMSKGMDTTAADAEFSAEFMSQTGVNKSSPTLNMAGSRGSWGVPYLNGWTNVPFTGYGQ